MKKAEADLLREWQHDIESMSNRTLSDRADLWSEAAAADWEEPTAAEFDQAADILLNWLEWEEVDTDNAEHAAALVWYAMRLHRRAGVRAYLKRRGGVNIMDDSHTDTELMTAEQLRAWTDQGRDIDGKEYDTKGGVEFVKYREATKRKPAGYYYSRRRYTIKRGYSLEAYEESNPELTNTRNSYADTIAALEALEALAERANLTDTERRALDKFASDKAREAGAEARAEYYRKPQKQHTEAGANDAEYTARIKYAYAAIGIKTDRTRQRVHKALLDKLRAAYGTGTAATVQTPTEYAIKCRAYWRVMVEANKGNTTAGEAPNANRRAAEAVRGKLTAAKMNQKHRGNGYKLTATEHTHSREKYAGQRAAIVWTEPKTYTASELRAAEREQAKRNRAEAKNRAAIADDIALLDCRRRYYAMSDNVGYIWDRLSRAEQLHSLYTERAEEATAAYFAAVDRQHEASRKAAEAADRAAEAHDTAERMNTEAAANGHRASRRYTERAEEAKRAHAAALEAVTKARAERAEAAARAEAAREAAEKHRKAADRAERARIRAK